MWHECNSARTLASPCVGSITRESHPFRILSSFFPTIRSLKSSPSLAWGQPCKISDAGLGYFVRSSLINHCSCSTYQAVDGYKSSVIRSAPGKQSEDIVTILDG